MKFLVIVSLVLCLVKVSIQHPYGYGEDRSNTQRKQRVNNQHVTGTESLGYSEDRRSTNSGGSYSNVGSFADSGSNGGAIVFPSDKDEANNGFRSVNQNNFNQRKGQGFSSGQGSFTPQTSYKSSSAEQGFVSSGSHGKEFFTKLKGIHHKVIGGFIAIVGHGLSTHGGSNSHSHKSHVHGTHHGQGGNNQGFNNGLHGGNNGFNQGASGQGNHQNPSSYGFKGGNGGTGSFGSNNSGRNLGSSHGSSGNNIGFGNVPPSHNNEHGSSGSNGFSSTNSNSNSFLGGNGANGFATASASSNADSSLKKGGSSYGRH